MVVAFYKQSLFLYNNIDSIKDTKNHFNEFLASQVYTIE